MSGQGDKGKAKAAVYKQGIKRSHQPPTDEPRPTPPPAPTLKDDREPDDYKADSVAAFLDILVTPRRALSDSDRRRRDPAAGDNGNDEGEATPRAGSPQKRSGGTISGGVLSSSPEDSGVDDQGFSHEQTSEAMRRSRDPTRSEARRRARNRTPTPESSGGKLR